MSGGGAGQQEAPPLTASALRKAMLPFMSRVVESPLVPPGTAYVFNEAREPTPEGWDALTAREQLQWAVDHGAVVVVRGIG